MRSENLLRGLEMAGEHKRSFSVDENGVRKYPLTRRFLDNLLIEFIKVETGFKEEKEEKYFDISVDRIKKAEIDNNNLNLFLNND